MKHKSVYFLAKDFWTMTLKNTVPKTLKMWGKVQKSLPKIHDKKIALTDGNNLHNLH